MNQITSFENDIKNTLNQILHSFSNIFETNNITFNQPEIEVFNSSLNQYESEFRIMFFKDGEFLDIVEQHIFRQGNKIAELEEYKLWIKEAITDIVNLV